MFYDLQAWFMPLLWIIGTITTLVLFVRFCSPVWKMLQSPKQLAIAIAALELKIDGHNEKVAADLETFRQEIESLQATDQLSKEVHLALLRDQIMQGYRYYATQDRIDGEAYKSLCDMHSIYHKLGGNSYIDAVMEKLGIIYKNQPAV